MRMDEKHFNKGQIQFKVFPSCLAKSSDFGFALRFVHTELRQRQRQHKYFSVKNGLHDILWKCSHGDLWQRQWQRCRHQMGLMPNCDGNGNGKILPFPSCNGYRVNFCSFLKNHLLVIFRYFLNKMNHKQYRILAKRHRKTYISSLYVVAY